MTQLFPHRHSWLCTPLAALTALIGCWATPAWTQSETSLTLTYQGRTVDSAPYFYAFPYRLERVSIEHRKIYFSRNVEGEGKRLFTTDWDPTRSLTINSDTAEKVTDVDLNTINFWARALNTRLNGLIVEADEDKAERINLWLFADGADAPIRLTDVDYVYDFDQAEDHSAVYYTARHGASDAAKGCLEQLSIGRDGATSVQQLICDDDPAMPAQDQLVGRLTGRCGSRCFPRTKRRRPQQARTIRLQSVRWVCLAAI